MRYVYIKKKLGMCAYCETKRLSMVDYLELIGRHFPVLKLRNRIGIENITVTLVDKMVLVTFLSLVIFCLSIYGVCLLRKWVKLFVPRLY